MKDVGIYVSLYGLIASLIIPYIVSMVIIRGFYSREQELRELGKIRSVQISVFGNSVILLLVFLITYLEDAPLQKCIQLFTANCSYQDLTRIAAMSVICLILSGVFTIVGIFVFFGGLRETIRKRYKGIVLMLCSAMAIPVFMGFSYAKNGQKNLEIIEFCRKMSAETESEDEEETENEDISYVTLRNTGNLTLEIKNVYLSANDDYFQMNEILGVTLKPNETYQYVMDEETSLDVKKDGGTVVSLSDGQGTVIDQVIVAALGRDESYQKREDGWMVVSLAEPTEEAVFVQPPTFSLASGFLEEEADLELSADPGLRIYYTLDGSDPSENSLLYTDAVHIYDKSSEPNVYRAIQNVRRDYLNHGQVGVTQGNKAFIVRAVAVDEDGNCSNSVTATYFVNLDQYKDGLTISLISDPDGLFGDERGIYVTGKAYDEWYMQKIQNTPEGEAIDTIGMPMENYMRQGMEWERETNMEVFEDGALVMNQLVGIRIQGNSARYATARKRFSIYARKKYTGSSFFEYEFFEDLKSHNLVLRSGALYAASQCMGKGRDVATINFQKVYVFLDGEFWYTTYLYEKFSEQNFAQKYGLSKENIVMVKNGELPKNVNDSVSKYSDIVGFLKRYDMSKDENYNKYNSIVDVQSYIEMLCFHIFLANMDVRQEWNNLVWHTSVAENDQEGDTRWRWGLYDMDLIWSSLNSEFGQVESYEINPFTMHGTYQDTPINGWSVYHELRKNANFRRQFVTTFMDLINTNFSAENTSRILNGLIGSSRQYRIFFSKRPEYVVPFVAEEFELKGTKETVTLCSNVDGSPIQLNTIQPELRSDERLEAFEWSGDYFTDYPIQVTADRDDFLRWEVTAGGKTTSYTEKSLEISIQKGGVQIYAIFE